MTGGSVKWVARNERCWRMYHSFRSSERKSASLRTECRAAFLRQIGEMFSAYCNLSRAGEFFYARSLMPLESVITVDCTRSFSDISENVSYISTAMNGELWHSCMRSPEKLSDSTRRLTRRLTFVNFARSLATTPEDWCRDTENSVFFSYSLRRLSLSDTDIARFQKWISHELYSTKF